MNGNINPSPQITDQQENGINDQTTTNSTGNISSKPNLNQEELQRREAEKERMPNILNDVAKNLYNIMEESRTLTSTSSSSPCQRCALRESCHRMIRYLQNISNDPANTILNVSKESQISSSACQCPVKTLAELDARIMKVVQEKLQECGVMQGISQNIPRNLSITISPSEVIMSQHQQTEQNRHGSRPSQRQDIQTPTSMSKSRRSSAAAISIEESEQHSLVIDQPLQLQQSSSQSLPSASRSTEPSPRLQRQEYFQLNSPLVIPQSSTRMPFTSPTSMLPPQQHLLPLQLFQSPELQNEQNTDGTSSEHQAVQTSSTMPDSHRSSVTAAETIPNKESEPPPSFILPPQPHHLQPPPLQSHPSTPQISQTSPRRLQRQQSLQMRSPPTTPRSTRTRFFSPTSLLPPLPLPPVPILRSPVLLTSAPRLTPRTPISTAPPQRCIIPFCTGGLPPRMPPPGLPLNQYQTYVASLLQAQATAARQQQQQNQRLPCPPQTPTSSASNSSNPYLQQFPRIPLDPQERERLNQMFYANVLRPPIQLPPPPSYVSSQQQQPPQLQPEQPQIQPPRRTRKRRRISPSKLRPIIPRPLELQPLSPPQQQQQEQQPSNTNNILPPLSVPILANNRTNTDTGPLFNFAGPPVLYRSTEEGEENGRSSINVNPNPLNETETVTEESHDQDVIIVEHEHHPQDHSFSRQSTTCLETPPLYIVDGDDETENEAPSLLPKTVDVTFSLPFQQQHTQDQHQKRPPVAESSSPLSSPTASSEASSASSGFDFTKSKAFFDAYFRDKPMLQGYYKIIQDQRPQDLPRYLSTVGMAHNLQNPKNLYENLVQSGKANARKLLTEAAKDIQICSKCNESSTPLPEDLLTALTELCNATTEEATKQALMKVTALTCDGLSSAMEKIFVETKFNIGSPTPPSLTNKVQNAIDSTLAAAEIYEKCSIIWNYNPIKNIKITVAEEFVRMKLLTEEDKKKIINNSGCEHNWMDQQCVSLLVQEIN